MAVVSSLRDLTQHLTTRADDSHAAPVLRFSFDATRKTLPTFDMYGIRQRWLSARKRTQHLTTRADYSHAAPVLRFSFEHETTFDMYGSYQRWFRARKRTVTQVLHGCRQLVS